CNPVFLIIGDRRKRELATRGYQDLPAPTRSDRNRAEIPNPKIQIPKKIPRGKMHERELTLQMPDFDGPPLPRPSPPKEEREKTLSRNDAVGRAVPLTPALSSRGGEGEDFSDALLAKPSGH